MKIVVFLLLFWIFPLLAVADVAHQNDDKSKSRVKELIELSIDELLNVTIITASRTEEKAEDVPASVVVIGRDEIEKYGYRTLAEILQSIPGVYGIDHYYREGVALGMRGFWSWFLLPN